MESTIEKVAMFCQVEREQVVAVHDVGSTYWVPGVLEKQGLIPSLSKILEMGNLNLSTSQIQKGANTLHAWKRLTASQQQAAYDDSTYVTIVLVGKSTSFADSYISVIKSLEHSAMACKGKLNLVMVDASHLQEGTTLEEHAKAWRIVRTAQGILAPGGFGHRGTEGMILAAHWDRTNKTPFIGVCLGMQIAVIELARKVYKLKAGSAEMDEAVADPEINYMPEINRTKLGGTMRLGSRPNLSQNGSEWSKLRALYGKNIIDECHQRRYEVNPSYIETLSSHGLNFVKRDDKNERMEIVELKDQEHPLYVGVQLHPEYLSRVPGPSTPYSGFFAASAGRLDKVVKMKRGDKI